MKLDLGGTACYEDPGSVSISRDDLDNSGDEITPQVNGDYNLMPFASNTFDAALGSCYLEHEPNWFELARVLKRGAVVKVKSCGVPYASEDDIIRSAISVGFELVTRIAFDDIGEPDGPLVIRKR